jgi:transposase
MKRFIEGQARDQVTLLPECLEDWADENNPVRVIDAFVEALELDALGFAGVDPKATGRPAYHPAVLLKLYIYGYLNAVQSSRRLEREARCNVEVMWLLGRLIPDHKTIAEFRRTNGPAIRKVCAQFVELCRRLGLLAHASVAIDGSKFKAVNNRDRNFTEAKMKRRMTQIVDSVARYIHQLESADRQEQSKAIIMRTKRLKEKIAKLKTEMDRLEGVNERRDAEPDKQISMTDPDARSMATSGRGSGVVGYNVQAAVDTKHHLIVTHEVTQSGSDRSQLAPMSKKAKQVLGKSWKSTNSMWLPIAATSQANRSSNALMPTSLSPCPNRRPRTTSSKACSSKPTFDTSPAMITISAPPARPCRVA